ncbi:MAG: prolyl oligopeptidase family serine peptidase [Cyclobacteriaceae bacterium]|jgi:dipeptidyl-peptidase 4|nr:prolyl oligopeptidase family serine peptidase [Cyclobacteriaceae bacterium]
MSKRNIFLLALLLPLQIAAQQVTREDYRRAVSFLWGNLRDSKVYNVTVNPNWNSDGGFFYTLSDKDGKTYYLSAPDSKKPVTLFDHERLAKLLADSLKITIKANDLPLEELKYLNKKEIEFSAKGKIYMLNTDYYTLSLKAKDAVNRLESKSPDGNWIAYNNHYNLFVKSTKTGIVKQLSTAGVKDYEYATFYGWGEIIEGENGTRPPHLNVTWSPDSKWISTNIVDFRIGNKMYLLDWSIDSLYRPKLLSYYRGSPGDTDMIHLIPVFVNIETGEEIRKDEFRSVNGSSINWSLEAGVAYIQHGQRGYQHFDFYRTDLTKKTQDVLYSETSKTNIDNFEYHIEESLGKIIMISEQDGWRHLYTFDLKEKKLKQLTSGSWYFHDLKYTDKKRGTLIFTASGREKNSNPYSLQCYKINLDGTGLTLLTPEDLNHDVSVSPDGKYFVDNMSSFNTPTKTVLRETASGKIIKTISEMNLDGLLAINFKFPEMFTAVARDGATMIYGMIWKPTNFDASKKYPVIDQTYTGPHTHMFPEHIVSTLARSNQALAELGFIVVAVDGMGTAGRSKAFHNVSYKNMGKNLLDHVLAIKQLGKKYAWVDTTRVGIFGHSAGGYDAGHAVLEFPDFYKVAVASSGDHDFRMEKDWWPEMYMGWPVDSTYDKVSNITMAVNLKGKLLLVHGGLDENVNPSATFKFAEALVKNDKEFDMLIFPSQHHGYQGKFNDYFLKKRWNYFVENLLGQKPIWDFSLKP